MKLLLHLQQCNDSILCLFYYTHLQSLLLDISHFSISSLFTFLTSMYTAGGMSTLHTPVSSQCSWHIKIITPLKIKSVSCPPVDIWRLLEGVMLPWLGITALSDCVLFLLPRHAESQQKHLAERTLSK